MPSEICCPFCQARQPYSDAPELWSETGAWGGPIYYCPCRAVGAPMGTDLWGAGWCVSEAEEALCGRFLETPRHACDVDLNSVTQTDPPRMLLWAKRRASPPGQLRKESTP